MQQDDVTDVVCKEQSILKLGEHLFNKHGHQGSRVRLIWAHMRLEFGLVQPNILFGRTGATKKVSGINIFFIFF